MIPNVHPAYTWPFCLLVWDKWYQHTEQLIHTNYLESEQSVKASLFWRRTSHAAFDLDMLNFYGCLDSGLL